MNKATYQIRSTLESECFKKGQRREKKKKKEKKKEKKQKEKKKMRAE